MPHRRATDTDPMDGILLWVVQPQGQWRSISTELSPDRHRGWPHHPSQRNGACGTIIEERVIKTEQTQEQNKKEWASSVDINRNIPTTWRWSHGDPRKATDLVWNCLLITSVQLCTFMLNHVWNNGGIYNGADRIVRIWPITIRLGVKNQLVIIYPVRMQVIWVFALNCNVYVPSLVIQKFPLEQHQFIVQLTDFKRTVKWKIQLFHETNIYLKTESPLHDAFQAKNKKV